MDFHLHKTGDRKKRILKTVLGIAILVLSSVLILKEGYYQYQIRQVVLPSSGLFPFIISKGEMPDQVAFHLENEGFINSSWVFLKYAERSGDANHFQAGKFYLHQNMAYPKLSETLTKAAINEISVTLQEGLTNADIDQQLVRLGLIEEGEFLECVRSCDFSDFVFLPKDPELREGFFFPDTYFVIPDQFDTETFAKRLLSTFDSKTKTIFGNADRNGWDILKMASIIEKESKDDSERPIIAGILWKRLDNGWMLGADATTRYITGKNTEPLTANDLSDPNEWNTRAVRGLPPGAICNPGLSSIWAAANPEESDFWFYLHGADGEIHYAKTSEEHAENKAEYL